MTEDHKPWIVHQVFGPPGTGKTRYLTAKVREIVRLYGPDSLVVVSFSVTAAQEIASRGLGLPPRSVGTLHSLAFRSIGHDFAVALDPDILKDWNAEAGREWKITADTRRSKPQAATEGGASNTDATTASNGDELLASLDRARSTFVEPVDYAPELTAFADAWEDWKKRASAIDYTDMIFLALQQAREGAPAPGNPRVLVVDEGQDMTPLETELALEWGKKAASLVIALDDDQAIMEWRGGDPRKLLELGNGDGWTVDRHILGKSYRIPLAVHRVAEQWVKRLSIRQPKEYLPRTILEQVYDAQGAPLVDEDNQPIETDTGEIIEGAAWCVSESLESPRLIESIEHEVGNGRTVMVIATCAYMLEPVLKGLRAIGMPFHNPYRPAEARWNPLGRRNGTSTASRILAYMRPHPDMGDDEGRLWTADDMQSWVDLVRSSGSGLRRGAKVAVGDLPSGEVAWEQVAALFEDAALLDRAVTPDLEWLAENIIPSKAKPTAYPLQVCRKRGPLALLHKPKVIIGTIHSVKGGSSDVVYLAPDVSNAGMSQLQESENGRDQAVRQFYVGMTRSYEELRLLAPCSRNFVKRRDLIPASLEVPA